jgi:HTH-type transcriptional regulator / antitoxin HigA
MNSSSKNFQPDWNSSPGDTISDILYEKKIELDMFASRIKYPVQDVIKLLGGDLPISFDLAERLEYVLGGSQEFWIKRELNYRTHAIRIKKLKEQEWLNGLPLKDMIKFGWIKDTSNLLESCLNYFNVPDIDNWNRKYHLEVKISSFRKSKSYMSDLGATSAWLRQGEIQSESIVCEDWNADEFEKALINIKPLTRKKNPRDFIPTILLECAKCGVAVAFVPTPSGCRASGATRFLSPKRALLLLSFRYLSDDHFWFTFFHEAGHILLHPKESVFLEEITREEVQDELEKDANIFSGEMLIPYEIKSDLSKIRGNKRRIIEFASKAGVSPGIIIGQLQYLGYIDFKYLNSYKRRYNWDDIEESLKSISNQ